MNGHDGFTRQCHLVEEKGSLIAFIFLGPTGRRFRRAVDSDKSYIELFSKSEINEKLFGDVNIGSLIELSTLPICMINENKDVVGFMALCDHPNVTSVNPADWETWIRNMFQRYHMSRNTLFIHFMCFDVSVSEHFMEEAFISVFLNDFYLTRISMVVSAKGPDENLMKYLHIKKRKMYKYTAKSVELSDKVYYFLYTAQRQDFCPKLRMRRAVEEDNDDIVAILDKKSPKLKEIYGEYYISEIVGRIPESGRKLIVAEHQEQAVGVMCLNSEINYKKLQTLYELKPFYGLRKATPLEKEQNKRQNKLLSDFGDPIMLGKWSPFDDLGKIEETYFDDVNFKRNAAMRHSMDHIIYRQQTSDDFSEKDSLARTPSQTTLSFTDILLEEDPFDYEIVNIDKSLLTIPEMVSLDNIVRLTSREDCQNHLSQFFDQKPQNFYSNGITSLPTRWQKPKMYKRYVDDTFAVLPNDKVSAFLDHLNSISRYDNKACCGHAILASILR
ncbi:hypothetical protein K1T71_008352 [Dendrolimus kikuchii]|uniref:Uncharacterized protein n=1 Tax=Dendrolimus kikuchii TaxID=765133 RepID=A0ACC1CWZ9_9NEOP|nr:hypothetical protein K1T71_008352 [Dendrolimus kikuchii]